MPEPQETLTGAPAIGVLADGFSLRLDEWNVWRLPSVCADGGAFGPFWLAAASLCGLGHLQHGRTGQDSYSFAMAADGGAVCVAVADGLGSRPHSAQAGAVLSARMVCSRLASLPVPDVLDAPDASVSTALRAANDDVQWYRDRVAPGVPDDDLAATLAFAWIPADHRRHLALAGRVGDCSAATLTGSMLGPVFPHGEDPLDVVRASLPCDDPDEGLELRELDLSRSPAIALMTDGLAEDVRNSPAVREWLAKSWSIPCGPHRMTDILRYRRQGSHDDRTALVVWPV